MKPDDRHREAVRTDLHRCVDIAVDAWPHALTDASARGYPTGAAPGGGSGPGDPTAAFHAKPVATQWLADLAHTIEAVYWLGNVALRRWPAAPKKQTAPLGTRATDVEICGLCQTPILGGVDDPLRRIGDETFHGKRQPGSEVSCHWQVSSQRREKTG